MKIILSIAILILPLAGMAQKVLIPSGSTVQTLTNGKSEKVITDKTMVLSSESPLLVQTSGGAPLLIFAAHTSSSVIDIKKLDMKAYLKELIVEEMNQTMNEIAKVHVEVLGLIQKKNLVQALDRVKDLQGKYPNLAMGYFLEGTVQYLLGNKDLAIKSLDQGLSIDPKDDNAKKLLSNLKGGSR